MKIAEVSKRYGISPDTLRYYEKEGVIPSVSRGAGGIRYYTEEDCKWIELAQCLRAAGLPVEAIIEYRRLFVQGDSTIGDRLELLERQRDAISKRIEAEELALRKLDYKISRYRIAVDTGVLTWDEDQCEN